MWLRVALGLCLLASAAGQASADEVTLQGGRKLVGKARWTEEGLEVVLESGAAVFPKHEVLSVEWKPLPKEELARRRGELLADDLPGRVSLARFGLEHALEPEARALLLQVVESPAPPPLAEGEAPGAARRAADAARAEAETLLRGLSYQLVDGRWTSPEEYYPPRGFVKHKGKWVPRAEVERQKAARARRSAEQEEDQARRKERSASRRADRALDALETAQEELARAEARIEHYEGELVRIEGLLVGARRDLIARERELSQAEQEAAAQVLVYDALLANPCRCPPHPCSCGWDQRRRQLLVVLDAVQRRTAQARLRRNEAAERVRRHEADLLEAQRLLAKARGTRGQAAETVKAREREVERREGEVHEAAEQADKAGRRADQADEQVERAEEELREGAEQPEAPRAERPAPEAPPPGE